MGHCHWKQHIEDYTRPRPVAVKTMTLRKTATKKAILRKLLNQYVDFFKPEKSTQLTTKEMEPCFARFCVDLQVTPNILLGSRRLGLAQKYIYTYTFICLSMCVCKCVGNYVCLFLVTSLMCDTRFFTYLQNA